MKRVVCFLIATTMLITACNKSDSNIEDEAPVINAEESVEDTNESDSGEVPVEEEYLISEEDEWDFKHFAQLRAVQALLVSYAEREAGTNQALKSVIEGTDGIPEEMKASLIESVMNGDDGLLLAAEMESLVLSYAPENFMDTSGLFKGKVMEDTPSKYSDFSKAFKNWRLHQIALFSDYLETKNEANIFEAVNEQVKFYRIFRDLQNFATGEGTEGSVEARIVHDEFTHLATAWTSYMYDQRGIIDTDNILRYMESVGNSKSLVDESGVMQEVSETWITERESETLRNEYVYSYLVNAFQNGITKPEFADYEEVLTRKSVSYAAQLKKLFPKDVDTLHSTEAANILNRMYGGTGTNLTYRVSEALSRNIVVRSDEDYLHHFEDALDETKKIISSSAMVAQVSEDSEEIRQALSELSQAHISLFDIRNAYLEGADPELVSEETVNKMKQTADNIRLFLGNRVDLEILTPEKNSISIQQYIERLGALK